MKKIVVFLVISALMMSFVGCASADVDSDSNTSISSQQSAQESTSEESKEEKCSFSRTYIAKDRGIKSN